MDRICSAVLDRIFALSPVGRYVIIAEDEFLETFPEDSEKTYDELNRALYTLAEGGYIDLKYSRGDMYCVAPLKKFIEKPEPVASEEPKKKRLDFIFFSAFAGGALGSLIVSVIFAIL